jgi:hypothetical protein
MNESEHEELLKKIHEQQQLFPGEEWSEEDIKEMAKYIIEDKQKRQEFSELEMDEGYRKEVKVGPKMHISPS